MPALTDPARYIPDAALLRFSLCTFLAAALVLLIAFEASLPRPWWALLTVYVTAQPLAGALRPRMLYRFGGIAVGAVATLLLAPNLQNTPLLLVLCMSLWIGLCIYLAMLHRGPRAFLFQMAGFSSAVICFPYLDDPGDIFMTTMARIEEMLVAIVCVTGVHMLLRPVDPVAMLQTRMGRMLAETAQWGRNTLEQAVKPCDDRRSSLARYRLAADLTELGLIAERLAYEPGRATTTRAAISALQHRLARVLLAASAMEGRMQYVRFADDRSAALLREVVAYLAACRPHPVAPDQVLAAGCRRQAAQLLQHPDAAQAGTASLLLQCAELVEQLGAALVQLRAVDAKPESARPPWTPGRSGRFPLAADHHLAVVTAVAASMALMVYCATWIVLAWPSGSATAAFAALVTCSYIALDDPAPLIGRYLLATVQTFPLAALYLFVILPRVDGAMMLLLCLAPMLVWIGYIQADPARAAQAIPMISCFVVATGLLDRYQADFAVFANTGLAQLGGIATALGLTRLFRSLDARRRAWRLLHGHWRQLARLAEPRTDVDMETWIARAIDRCGQLAARGTVVDEDILLQAVDGLRDVRVGMLLVQLRHGLAVQPPPSPQILVELIAAVAAQFDLGALQEQPLALSASLLQKLRAAISWSVDSAGSDPWPLPVLLELACELGADAVVLEALPR